MIFKNISNGKIVQLKGSSEMIFFFILELWKTVGKDLSRALLLQGMNARKRKAIRTDFIF